MVGLEKKSWSKFANNKDWGGTFNLVSRKKKPTPKKDPITQISKEKGV